MTTQQHPIRIKRPAAGRKQRFRSLLIERLEQRQLLAGDGLNLALISSAVQQAELVRQAAAQDTVAIIYDSQTATSSTLADLAESVSEAYGGALIGHLAIVTHGQDGQFQIGANDYASSATLAEKEEELLRLGSLLSVDARLDLYACNIAASFIGTRFVDELAATLQVDVYASNNSVGSGDAGDFAWEYSTAPQIKPNELFNFDRLERITDLVLPLPGANLTDPPNNASGVSLTPIFDWDPVLGADIYRVVVSTNLADLPRNPDDPLDAPGIVVSELTSSSSLPSPKTLAANKLHYWTVRAAGPSGGGDWSASRRFTTGWGSDTTAPSFLNPKLGGHAPDTSFQVTLGEVLQFSGTVSDNEQLDKITIGTNSPATANHNRSFYVSGTSRSLSNYSYETSNSVYAGVTGIYQVKLWAKDKAGNADNREWIFTVVASDNSPPSFSNPKLGGHAPDTSFQVTLGDVLQFSGTVMDNDQLARITIGTNSPTVADHKRQFDVGGMSQSLANYSFDTNNTDYAGATGTYQVKLWAADKAGNPPVNREWIFTVVAGVNQDPGFANVKLNGYAPGTDFQVTLGEALNFSGAVTDDVELKTATIVVVNWKVPDAAEVDSFNISGKSHSISAYSVDTGNPTYANVTGNYRVKLWVEDAAGPTERRILVFRSGSPYRPRGA